MKSKISRILSVFLACMIASTGSVTFLCSEANAEDSENTTADQKVIRVGWYTDDSKVKPSESSGSYGYMYEYLQALSQYTHWKYEYVRGSWDQCLNWLKEGKIDTMGFVHKTNEREKYFGFPELPMAMTSGLIVTNSNSKLQNAEKTSLEGSTVGIVKGNNYNEDFKKYCTQEGINVKYVEYEQLSDISPALKKGKIDVGVVAEEDKTSSEKTLKTLSSKNQYFVTNINDTALLDELDTAMLNVNNYCPDLNNTLYQRYLNLTVNGKPNFTADEIQFIKKNPDILVQYDSGWPPVEYYDEDQQKYVGISPDLFALLSKKCGINFVYEGSTSGDVLSNLKKSDTKNIVTTISYDYSWAESHNVYITQPFISSSIIKMGKDLDKKNPKIAVNKKAYFTYVLADELKGAKLLDYATPAERIEAVDSGKADYTFVTEDQAAYYRSIPKYSDLKTENMVGYDQQICISVTQNSDPALMTIISKSLASITHDEMNAIIIKNTVNPYKLTLWDKIYKNRVVIIASLLCLIALIVLVIAKLRINKTKRIAAVEANKAKSEFLSHVSHDIRTPLNAIIGITSLAIDENDPKIKRDYLKKINESGEYLLGLINDTLDMSKIESGKITLHYEPVNYREIYDVIMAVIMPKAKEKHIALSTGETNVGDKYVMMDKLRFEQIILNLLNNAVKFTPEYGTISCAVTVTERTDTTISHKVIIADTGVGMSEDFMKKLFEPFEQERNRLSVENSGTGLGLSIVKSLIDIMGGTISCTSKKNEGTEFVIELTSKLATPEEIVAMAGEYTPETDEIFNKKNILLAEDNSMNTLVAVKLLEKKGMTVVSTKNGEEVIEAFKNSELGTFDVILMDIHMPLMDGLEATKRIRRSDHPDAASIQIVALSANAYSEDREECLEAGMNDHVAKPIEPDLLYEALRHAFQKKSK